MSQLKALGETIVFTRNMHSVVTALQELGILEMERIRKDVLTTRSYMQGLLDIFLDLRISEQKSIEKELEKKLPQEKIALVFLSQNQLFSDTNIRTVWRDFVSALDQYPGAEIVVVGGVGKDLSQNEKALQRRTVHTVSIPSRVADFSDLGELFQAIAAFDRVVVFHGEFVSLVEQQSIQQDVTGRETLLNAQEFAQRKQREFLFEPHLPAILGFFEKEVQKGIVKQVLHESRLAHVGSRIQTLESSRESIQQRLRKLDLQQKRAFRRQQTRKQQQRLAGLFA